MTLATRALPIRTLCHDGPEGSWAWHRRDLSPRLRSEVLSCAGFEERNVDLRRRRELPPPAVPLILTLEGADHARAKEAGAEIARPLEDIPYGSREYSARDPEGQLWHFGSYDPFEPSRAG